jgi:hypothetical protein
MIYCQLATLMKPINAIHETLRYGKLQSLVIHRGPLLGDLVAQVGT